MAEDGKRPLQDEAAAREEWRGSDEPARPEGGSLPASEDEDERMGGGAGGDTAPTGPPGTIRPPD
jgi:hypothetical protein